MFIRSGGMGDLEPRLVRPADCSLARCHLSAWRYTDPMNVRSPQAASADEERVSSLMASVERLVAERRDTEALALFNQAAAILPGHPRVLHERARRLALGGNPGAARTVLEQVV